MSAAAMYPEIRQLLGSAVVVNSEATIDGFGKRTFSPKSNSPYKCYPVYENRRVWSLEGREETTSIVLYVDADDLSASDQYQFNGRIYRCVSVETWVNELSQTIGQVAYLQ